MNEDTRPSGTRGDSSGAVASFLSGGVTRFVGDIHTQESGRGPRRPLDDLVRETGGDLCDATHGK
jgi:hypothetical protein